LKTGKKLPSAAVIGIVLMIIYVPVVCVVVFSFNDSRSSVTWAGFTLDWYARMFSQKTLVGTLLMSLQIAALSAALSGFLGTVGAISMTGAGRRLKTAVALLTYVPLVLPEVVLAVALMMVFSAAGIRFGRLTLVLSHAAFCVPYIYILVSIRLKSVDKSLVEAARDLGASRLYAAVTVTLPLIAPAVASGALLAFAMSLDDVAISQFVSGPTTATFPVQVYSMLKLGVTPVVNAFSTLILLVTFTAVGVTVISGKGKRRDN
jgi:spermidine/putrescine transport system permease protein